MESKTEYTKTVTIPTDCNSNTDKLRQFLNGITLGLVTLLSQGVMKGSQRRDKFSLEIKITKVVEDGK